MRQHVYYTYMYMKYILLKSEAALYRNSQLGPMMSFGNIQWNYLELATTAECHFEIGKFPSGVVPLASVSFAPPGSASKRSCYLTTKMFGQVVLSVGAALRKSFFCPRLVLGLSLLLS